MVKITFMGAGSTVFARNMLGDCMAPEVLRDAEMALYDIDGKRLKESETILTAMNETMGSHATIKSYMGVENRKEALRGADFVVDAIQVGLYDPCTMIDFKVPKKYGLRQTITDTLGIGGNVQNTDFLITNLPEDACVEVPCMVDGTGVHPCHVGRPPVQLAAMNMTNINVQQLTIEAARTRKKEHIYQAAMLDPHTGSELDIDTIVKMVDELIETHGDWLPKYH